MERLRYAIPAVLTASGPVAVFAQAAGAFDAVHTSWLMPVAGGMLSVIGAMAAVIVSLFKREHSRMELATREIAATQAEQHKQTRASVHMLTKAVSELTADLERHAGELRSDIERRMTVESHASSSGRIHEKINRMDRSLAFMRAKMGLEEDAGEDKEAVE